MHNLLNESVLASEIIQRSVKCSDNHEIWNENLPKCLLILSLPLISIEGLRRKVSGHTNWATSALSLSSVKRLSLREQRKIRK